MQYVLQAQRTIINEPGRFSKGGPSVVRGTTYGAIDGPVGPSIAAILGLGRPSMARKIAINGPGGPILGGPSVAS